MQLKFAPRYAKALIDISNEQSKTEIVHKDMQMILETLKSNHELNSLIKSPILNSDKKKSIIKAIFENKINPLTLLFMETTIIKKREANLLEICQEYISQYNSINKIVSATYTSATPVSEDILSQVRNTLKSQLGVNDVELDAKVDPSLIGGFVLEYDHNILDGSILYDLKQIAKQFDNNEYVAKI